MENLKFIITFVMILSAIGAYIPILIDLKNKKPMNPISWWLWLFIDILILISIIQINGNILLITVYTIFTGIVAILSSKSNKLTYSLSEIIISVVVIIGSIIMKLNLLEGSTNVILTSSLAVIAGIPYGLFLITNKAIQKSTTRTAYLFLISALSGISLNLINNNNYIFSLFIGIYWFIIFLICLNKPYKKTPQYPYNLFI